MLVVIETHPVQYHAPVYRRLEQGFGIPVTAIYGSDFSVAGYTDREFGTTFAWDVDLLSGYSHRFLSTVQDGAAQSAEGASTRGLQKALVELQPRVILLLGYSPRFHQVAIWEARRFGCPLLFRGETTDHARSRSVLKSWLRDKALRPLYRSCARVLFVGQRSRAHFLRLGCPSEKMVFSPYCVDSSPFQCGETDRERLRPVTRCEMRIADSDIAILFSGKISFRKGPDLLVDAIRSLPAELRQRLVLVFLGDGELREHLADAARMGPQVRTHFAGFKNQCELSAFYHAADLLVLPSRFDETWGLVVNEALLHGVPVVASDAVGCVPDLIEPRITGEIFNSGSVESLGSALKRAVRLISLPCVRKNCRSKVSAYSVEKAGEGIASACEQILTRT